MALTADNYLYVLGVCPGSRGGYSQSYLVSSGGLAYVASGPGTQPFDRTTVAMIPDAGYLYLVSARDGTVSTIEAAESILDIDQISSGAITTYGISIGLDNCLAQSAYLDESTSQLLVNCWPGTGTPNALIVPIGSTAPPVAVTIPPPTAGTPLTAVLADGYVYVLMQNTPTDYLQSYSVSAGGVLTPIDQTSISNLDFCCTVTSMIPGGGYIYIAYLVDNTPGGGVDAIQISGGTFGSGGFMVGSCSPAVLTGGAVTGSLFFDALASAVVVSCDATTHRGDGADIILTAPPITVLGVNAVSDTSGNTANDSGLAAVAN
jgi:hypothetical protein